MSRIYVGTYRKYNEGSIRGDWLDPEDYSDKDEFLQACKELHEDEEDPELMFQDWEDIPEGMVSESHVSDDLWEWLDMSDTQREVWALYREHVNQDGDLDEAEEAYQGTYRSEGDFAEELYEDMGTEIPDSLRAHIDWSSVARELQMDGYTYVQHEGETWVFRSA
jgi:antirestriction protein